MILLVLGLPLVNVLCFLLFSRLLRPRFIAFINTAGLVSLACLLIILAPSFLQGAVYTFNFGQWVTSALFSVSWTFSIDALTYSMLVTVTIVSACVHLYSIGYMGDDPHFSRFMSYLSIFTFFMFLLVTANNFILLFFGWEGVGLASYLLIGFWYTRIAASKAAFKAMIVNRISDTAFTLGILTIFAVFKSSDFGVIFATAAYTSNADNSLFSLLSISSLLLFFGAMGKSAQLGLHTWLPDAMEGPTPVSALIHAATMVTAGIFLIVRCSPLFSLTPAILFFMLLVGSGTAFIAATIGLVQDDAKKIIAYSTCSQLGYMVLICALSGYSLGLFHLVNHAFFKALLFLAAGMLIHAVSDEQDIRRMGGLARLLPGTAAMFAIGSTALTAVQFSTGFYSKDLILEIAMYTFTPYSGFAYFVGLAGAAVTATYSARLLLLVFNGPTGAARVTVQKIHEGTWPMLFACSVLAVGSIFFGHILHEAFVGVGTSLWRGGAGISALFLDAHILAEGLPFYIKYIPFGIWLAPLVIIFHYFRDPLFFELLSQRWHFDSMYNTYINKIIIEWAYDVSFVLLDKGFLEYIGPYGFSWQTLKTGRLLTDFQTGRVYEYAGFLLFSAYFITICFSVF